MAIYRRDIQELRKLRESARRKLKRLEAKGILTQMVDPRFPAGAATPRMNLDKWAEESRMTRKELNAYKQRLKNFTSRGNQYVAGSLGTPLSKNQWREYERARDKANKQLAKNNAIFENVPTQYGMTVKQYMAARKPVHPELHDPASNAYYWPSERTPKSFASDKALKAETKRMLERADPNFINRINKRQNRRVAKELLESTGDRSLVKRLKELNDYQFDLLWRFSRFADHASAVYEQYLQGVDAKGYTAALNRSHGQLEDTLKWAASQHEPKSK